MQEIHEEMETADWVYTSQLKVNGSNQRIEKNPKR